MQKVMGMLFLVLIFSMVSCSKDPAGLGKTNKIITVVSQPFSATAYYSGTIQPFKSVVVITPTDGVIEDALFHYGDRVKAGQLLFTMASEKFLSDYKTAVMQYIKSKNELSNNDSKLKESDFLYKNELISREELKSKQTEFYTSQLAFLEAKDTLTNLLKRLDLKGFNLYALKIEDIDKITQALHVQGDSQKLQIISPASGVVLVPTKGDGGEGDAPHLGKGDQVKQGSVLALVGDLNGLRIRISVNEFSVNQLKLKQKVNVTGTAFPDFVLQGEIAAIDHQAQASQGGGVPMFPVEIVIPKLTLQQQSIIHVGMSAKVEINVEGDNQIMLPLTAIVEKKGSAYVRIQDEKTGKIKEVPVKTGQTTVDEIVILEGLKPGDKVVT